MRSRFPTGPDEALADPGRPVIRAHGRVENTNADVGGLIDISSRWRILGLLTDATQTLDLANEGSDMTTAIENQELAQVEPGTLMGDMFRSYWLPALLSSELPFPGCPPVRVRLLGEDLLAFWTGDGEFGLTDEFCAHRRASLFLGRVEDCGIRCLYHGWQYAPDGACLDTPNEPRERFKESVKLKAYPCLELGGMIWTYMGPADQIPDPPQFEFAVVPDDARYLTKRLQHSNWLQAVEGNLDGSHVKSLHSDFYFWNTVIPGRPEGKRTVTVSEHTSTFQVEATPYGVMTAVGRPHPEGTSWRFNHVLMPCFQLIAPEPEFDPNFITHIMVPADTNQTWVYAIDYNAERPITASEVAYYQSGGGVQPELIAGTPVAVQNRDNDYLMDRPLQRSRPDMTGISRLAMQDAAMQESMGDVIPRELEHMCANDIAVVAYRRLLLGAAHAYRDHGTPPPGRDPATQRVRAQSAVIPGELDDWVAASVEYTTARGRHYDAAAS